MEINQYFIEQDFFIDELSQKFKEKIIDQFLKEISSLGPKSHNVEFYHNEFTTVVGDKFQEVVHTLFDVGEILRPVKTWIYLQNNETFSSHWHNHLSTSAVNAVFYIDPPQNGGELECCYNVEERFKITPRANKLYLFPGWMPHRPLPQEDCSWRIAVNLEYCCRERPILKKNSVIW